MAYIMKYASSSVPTFGWYVRTCVYCCVRACVFDCWCWKVCVESGRGRGGGRGSPPQVYARGGGRLGYSLLFPWLYLYVLFFFPNLHKLKHTNLTISLFIVSRLLFKV